MVTKFRETEAWKMGDTAQRAWANLVAAQGGTVLALYAMEDVHKSTKAPVLLTPTGLQVAPDLYIIRPQLEPIWCDVKAKSKPTWYRTHSRWEHGCDLAH